MAGGGPGVGRLTPRPPAAALGFRGNVLTKLQKMDFTPPPFPLKFEPTTMYDDDVTNYFSSRHVFVTVLKPKMKLTVYGPPPPPFACIGGTGGRAICTFRKWLQISQIYCHNQTRT
jgi:hypothetical protein